MASQGTDDAIGRVADGRELFTKLSKHGGFDLPDQAGEHANLFAVEVVCIAEEKIGYAPENLGASIARARGQNIFGRGLRHSCLGQDPSCRLPRLARSPAAAAPNGRKAMVKPAPIVSGPKNLCFKIAYATAARFHWAWMFPSLTTRPHLAISVLMYSANCSGVISTVAAPSRSKAACSSGDFKASCDAA